MGVFRGNAALRWIDSTDTSSQRVLLLREPVREIKSAHRMSVYTADSLDMTNRQVFTVGKGAYELSVRVRFSDDPQTLIDLIKAGSQKITIDYLPNLADPDTKFSCLLISPLSPSVLASDQDTGTIFGDQDVTLVLRKTDQTEFSAAWKNQTLFSYRAGGSLAKATFTRATSAANPATYPVSSGSAGGYGQLTTAKANVARLGWYSTASSAGPRSFPALLLEDQRTNRVLQSGNLKATTVWTNTSLTLTSGSQGPSSGTKAFKLLDASTTVIGNLKQNILINAATRATVSVFLAAGTGSVKSWIALRSTNGASTFIRGTVTWSSGIPTFGTSAKGQLIGPAERWRTGFYRQAFRTTGNLTTGNYAVVLIPAATAAAAKGSIIAYGPQVEN